MASVPICCRVRALYSFNSNDPASLTFEEDDYIDVLNKLESGWWDGWYVSILYTIPLTDIYI
ncbi:hypothetical protein F4703DRAFT_1843562 [Phycomyces blakesleeanus]